MSRRREAGHNIALIHLVIEADIIAEDEILTKLVLNYERARDLKSSERSCLVELDLGFTVVTF